MIMMPSVILSAMFILGPFDYMANFLIEKNDIIQSTNTVDSTKFTIDMDTNLYYT